MTRSAVFIVFGRRGLLNRLAVLLLKCPILHACESTEGDRHSYIPVVLNMFLVDSMIATYPQMVPVIVSI